jgi:hypothetical protein
VKTLNRINTDVFPEYILPQLAQCLSDSDSYVRRTYASILIFYISESHTNDIFDDDEYWHFIRQQREIDQQVRMEVMKDFWQTQR